MSAMFSRPSVRRCGWQARRYVPSLVLLGFVLVFGAGSLHEADGEEATSDATKIVVFDFELEDASAGGGIIAPDAYDIRYLSEATAEAKRLLKESGRFMLVSTEGADFSATKTFGLRSCNGCEAGIAARLGGAQSMLGVITRINRTEYTLLIKMTDARTGSEISTSYTNLRMGANYAWPRGVKWLMENQVLVRDAERHKAPAEAER